MYLIDEEDFLIVQLAAQFEGNGVLPEPGGLMDQSALTMASIGVVTGAWGKLREAQRRSKE